MELRSGLKARAMNVCGNRTSMSKGLYLVARKIASRWEYEPEWEGGDPTQPLGQGLPKNSQSSRGGGDDMDVDGAYGRRQRNVRRGRGNDMPADGGRDGRDGRDGRGGGRDVGRDSRDGRDGGRDSRDGRGGSRRDSGDDMRGMNDSRDSHSRGGGSGHYAPMPAPAAPAPAPAVAMTGTALTPQWADPTLLASVVGAQAGSPAAVASAESWARLLGQMPAATRETLGISVPRVPTAAAPAGNVYGQVLTQPQQPVAQQTAQVGI